MSEAKQEIEVAEKVTMPKEAQYVMGKSTNLTDLVSFNAYGFVTLSDGQVVGIQTTGRHGISADDMYKDFQAFVTFLDLCAIDHGVKFVEKRNGTYASETQAPKPALTPGNSSGSTGEKKRDYKTPLTEAEKPAELSDTNEDVYMAEFDLFKILPQPDDKATVEFWKDGLDFPVGAKMNKWKHDTIKLHLARLTEQAIDPAKASEHRIAGNQYWVKGNEFTITQGAHKGEKSNYKNIVLLKPAL